MAGGSRRVHHAGHGRRGGLLAGVDAGEAGRQDDRGARGAGGNQVRLLAALVGPHAASASPARNPVRQTPVALVGYVREQWSIESLHWVRDTLWQEDKSQVRTRNGPRIMAALRNLAIGALRLAGRPDITEATRWAGRSMDRPFTILGLTS